MSKRSGEFVTLRDLYRRGRRGCGALLLPHAARARARSTSTWTSPSEQTDENPVFYVQMAHARLSGIFRTAERDARERRGRARPRRTPRAAGHRAAQEARGVSRGGRRRRRASASRTASPCISTSWPPRCTAGTITPARSARPRAPRPSRLASCSPAPPASCWRTRSPCWASPLRTGCDLMSLLVVGSIALDSIFTPFGETADALGRLGGVLQRRRLAAAPGAGGRRGRQGLSGRRARASRGTRDRLVRASSGATARASGGRGSTPTICRAARRSRPGSACSPTFSPSSRDLSLGQVPVPRQHRSRAAARRPGPGDATRRSSCAIR